MLMHPSPVFLHVGFCVYNTPLNHQIFTDFCRMKTPHSAPCSPQRDWNLFTERSSQGRPARGVGGGRWEGGGGGGKRGKGGGSASPNLEEKVAKRERDWGRWVELEKCH